ncbi:SUMF1/EgtB/PvdO family nonheme iron enzyme [Vibrio sp. RE86]|uniref:formylglycine-generating enzyme family protein n=1 Tax=Vibrio sp. RE86 TaxID=2607605 RepID=UPI0014934A89|nr:formylglycine-generating enzyme family protein [Vibrio sp. RE86]NOH78441.1 SUMF1/EgtB/PvdO family nonheme iron enzyme [Vibrio sp. RE86]
MRLGLSALLIALSPCLALPTVWAQENALSIEQIDEQLYSKHDALRAAEQLKLEQQSTLVQLQTDVKALQARSKSLDSALSKAKTKLSESYKSLDEDPTTDLSSLQAKYQEVWTSIKTNQKALLDAELALEETQNTTAQTSREVNAIRKSLNNLEQAMVRARVNRLKSELAQPESVTISYTNRCSSSLTLAQCDSQTQSLALQKAVEQFRSKLPARVTEQSLVANNLDNTSLNIHVVKHSTRSSNFQDGEQFHTVMDVELEARPSTTAPCQLLSISSQYCYGAGTATSTSQLDQEIAWVTLNVSSNLSNSLVLIDGISYGVAPVEVMLPVGDHNVVVQKKGYNSFSKTMALEFDSELRAKLESDLYPLKTGRKFSDKMRNQSRAPELITITSGTYFIGEHASNQVRLKSSYGVGVTPITVSQFTRFVEDTAYRTDAELKNTCTALIDGETTPVENSNWRSPGFNQHPNSPVVCVSQNDASSYAKWLMKQTGQKYRLPTEDEWEIAARAGTSTKFWWGNEFLTGRANTGWSGTPWSNTSTSPVSAFKPNQLGLYDTVGNVWQWTSSSRGIAKGGAWNFSPEMAAADKQLYLSPSSAANYLGFRVVRDIR